MEKQVVKHRKNNNTAVTTASVSATIAWTARERNIIGDSMIRAQSKTLRFVKFQVKGVDDSNQNNGGRYNLKQRPNSPIQRMLRILRNAHGCTRPRQKKSSSGTIDESHGSTEIHNLGEGIYKVGEGSPPYVNAVPYNSDAVSDLLRSQTQSNSSFIDLLDLTMMPTENFCGRKRYLPDLNVPLLNTDAAPDKRRQTQSNSYIAYSLEQTLVPTTATPHPPPAANVGLDVQSFSTDPASRQQPKTQSKRSFEDESIVNSLSFYTAVSSHHSDLEYSFKTAASSCHSTGSFFTDSIPEIEMGTESQAETETRDLRMRFASRFWGVGASGNGSFSALKQQILDTMVESVVSGIVQECMRRFFDCL